MIDFWPKENYCILPQVTQKSKFFGGIFWEIFFGRIILGGFFGGRNCLGGFFGRIFFGGFFGKIFERIFLRGFLWEEFFVYVDLSRFWFL